MISAPIAKTVGMHGMSAMAGVFAGISFAASHSVDLYAVYDQLNVVIADITKLVGMLTPLGIAIYAGYQMTLKKRLAEIAKDDRVKGVVTTPEMAAIPSEKVVATAAELPKGA